MRVIAGTARRLILETGTGKDIRPTTDRLKEMVFNTIQYDVQNSLFLDLFSGTGAIAIEALSRGASKAILVEQNHDAIACIEKNLIKTKFVDKSEVLKYDYSRALQMIESRKVTFDIIYMDPPYNKGFEAKAIVLIDALSLLKKNGLLICESDAHTDFGFTNELDHLYIDKVKSYKTSKFTFFKYK